ncbi:hypothetical protein [Aliikangiella sp. G2MR2-5]|uniref:hypothetical protein n=1 Tax=Aliikangiella sp. G2MR2-5 TaxID=2788943 RepID=UPI0018AADF7B|nr:hypothetical protein [Aliikangiella sp. G2MR2-5]
MKEIFDLKIIGVDPTRPPKIRKEPYIELYFKLNHEAPMIWLKEFNDLVSKGEYPIKIKPENSSIIETWVRSIKEVEPAFNNIKLAVQTCIDNYRSRQQAQLDKARAAENGVVLSAAQIELNTVIENLNFDSDA